MRENIIVINSGTIIRAIAIVLGVAALYYLRDIVLVVIMALVVASAIEPATKWFHKKGVPRLLSVILMYFLIGIIFVGVLYFLFLPLLSETAGFLSSLPSYLADIKVWNPLESNGIFSSQGSLGALSQSFSLVDIVDQIDNTIARVSNGVFSTASSVFGGVLSFILVIVLSFYFSVESDGVTSFLRIVIPTPNESYIIDLWKRSQAKIGRWMQGQIILSIIIAILVFLGLTLLQIPNALLLAVIAGVFELIPLFGPILASIPAIAIALVENGTGSALLVLGLYIIVHQFENQLIYPLVVKKVVGLPPIISILALIIGAKLAGFIGLVISVPIAAAVMEFFNDIERHKLASVRNSG